MKAKKIITKAKFDNLELSKSNILSEITKSIAESISEKIDSYITEGLKRKGFEFKHPLELETFIKERCRCEDNTGLKLRTYYIDNDPFLLHSYETDNLIMSSIVDKDIKFKTNLGTYTYL